nr:MAG TPA: hypothetical protein [Bacteriophage sp.]
MKLVTQKEYDDLRERFFNAKTKEEYVALGVELIQTEVKPQTTEEYLAERWEYEHNATPAELRRRKWEAFWWKVTKSLRLIADGGLDIAVLIAFIALIIAAIALFRPAQ